IDIPFATAEFLVDRYGDKKLLYCPSNRVTKDFGINERYVSHESYGWVVTDYFWMMTFGLDWRKSDLNLNNSTDNYYNNPPYKTKIFADKFNVRRASEQPMTADFVGFQDGTNEDFTRIQGWDLFSTNHISSNGEPDGGNTVFFDGHTEWVHFDSMEVRYYSQTLHHWW
ncbi:MAG: hypothetical protein JW860_13660, partial [Sedimentisphaerales bacterium]|nr:hypothetical protein [Sedimentisphaerales bacterium]